METGSSVLSFRFQLPYRPDGFPEQGSRQLLLRGLFSDGGQFRVWRATMTEMPLFQSISQTLSFPPSFPIAEICCALRSTIRLATAGSDPQHPGEQHARSDAPRPTAQ
jgi:hypothetical protein